MSPQLRGMHFKAPQQQRGAIGLMAALTLGMVLLFMLLVIDSGRLYFEQRKLQRVADMAALEAVIQSKGSCEKKNLQKIVESSARKNDFMPGGVQGISPECGTLVTGSDNLRTFTADENQSDAIRVIATTIVPTSVAGALWNFLTKPGIILDTKLTASAVGASPKGLLAQISIRSTLASVTTDSQVALLNAVFTSLLGGKITLDVAGWNGLLNGDINLLNFMDQLAIDLKLSAGNYDQLLSVNTTVTQLLATALTVANANGATANLKASLTTLLEAALKVKSTNLKLGDLLNLATGTKSAGLDANLQAFQLVQAFLQVANSKNAVDLNLDTKIPGLLGLKLAMKVIEPPQFSAVGDPSSGQLISVRTAQVRTLISVDLGLGIISGLTNAVAGLTGTIFTALNNVLSLNLVGLLNDLVCPRPNGCTQISPLLLPDPQIFISLDAGGAKAQVTGYSCPAGDTGLKSLTVSTTKSLVDLRVGKIDPTTAFSSTAPPVATAIPIVDLGTQTCYKTLILFGSCDPRVPFAAGGIGLMANSSVLQSPAQSLVFSKNIKPDATPPNLKLPPALLATPPTKDIVNSLSSTLSGIVIQAYAPTKNNVFSTVLTAVTNLITSVSGLLNPVIQKLLSPLLDPLINNLLSALGISLVDVQIGANLNCGQGGRPQLIL